MFKSVLQFYFLITLIFTFNIVIFCSGRLKREANPKKRPTKITPVGPGPDPIKIPKNCRRFNKSGKECMKMFGKQCIPGKDKNLKECGGGGGAESGSEDLRTAAGVILAYIVSLTLVIFHMF